MKYEEGGLPCEAYVNWHEAQGLAVEVQTLGACTTPDEVYVGVLATPCRRPPEDREASPRPDRAAMKRQIHLLPTRNLFQQAEPPL